MEGDNEEMERASYTVQASVVLKLEVIQKGYRRVT